MLVSRRMRPRRPTELLRPDKEQSLRLDLVGDSRWCLTGSARTFELIDWSLLIITLIAELFK